ncbi:MAG: hypothetical protein IJF03_11015 [Lachnospiraceae bacterium]|nr:hypothetical protein [Lachnospiraceae bacterium]
MKYRKNEFEYVDAPKKKIVNYIIIGIGVLAILITGFLYAAKLNNNVDVAETLKNNIKNMHLS